MVSNGDGTGVSGGGGWHSVFGYYQSAPSSSDLIGMIAAPAVSVRKTTKSLTQKKVDQSSQK